MRGIVYAWVGSKVVERERAAEDVGRANASIRVASNEALWGTATHQASIGVLEEVSEETYASTPRSNVFSIPPAKAMFIRGAAHA